ncbi:MAG: PRTRC system protein E [Terriglobia bacterium]
MSGELMPLLAGRTVMTTVARENDKTLRVNVIPTTKSGVSENPALTTPLSRTGTSEELDTELSRELADYVECRRALGSTLAAAKAEMDAVAKAAWEEARKKAEERKKKSEKPTDKPADPAPSTVPTQPAPPATVSHVNTTWCWDARVPSAAQVASKSAKSCSVRVPF